MREAVSDLPHKGLLITPIQSHPPVQRTKPCIQVIVAVENLSTQGVPQADICRPLPEAAPIRQSLRTDAEHPCCLPRGKGKGIHWRNGGFLIDRFAQLKSQTSKDGDRRNTQRRQLPF